MEGPEYVVTRVEPVLGFCGSLVVAVARSERANRRAIPLVC